MSTCATASAWAGGLFSEKGKEIEMVLEKQLHHTIGGLGLKNRGVKWIKVAFCRNYMSNR